MPQVPVYDGPKVAPAPLRGGEQTALAPADAFGANQGKALQVAGGQAVDAAASMYVIQQDRNDAAKLFEAEAGVKTAYIDWAANQKKTRTGANAEGVVDDVKAWWTEAQQKHSQGLTSERQRRLFDQALVRLSQSSHQDFSHFENTQREHAFDVAAVAAKNTAINLAAGTTRPEDIDSAAKDIRAKNASLAVTKGWKPEVLNAQNDVDLTNLHKQVIQTIKVRSPVEAQAYYELKKNEIMGSQRAEIEDSLKQVVASAAGDGAANEIWQTMGPKTDIAPVELDKMEAAVREKFKGAPESAKAAIAGLRERAAAHNSSQAERAAGATNQVMEVWNSTKNLDRTKRSPAWTALPAAQQAKIEEHIIGIQTAALHRSNAALGQEELLANRDQRRMQRQGMGDYLKLSNPEVLANMSEAQVQALLPTLGNELTLHLMEKKRTLGKSADKLEDAKMDRADFDAVASRAGLDPYEKNNVAKQERLGELHLRVDQVLGTAAKDKGKPLTREEKREIMSTELSRQVLVDRSFWFNDKKPIIQLTPEEAAKVIVPPDRRELVIEALKAKNIPVNEANVRRLYLNTQAPAAARTIPNAKP